MRSNAQPYQPQISTAHARSQLAMLLTCARSLDGFTAEGLARTHRVKLAVAAVMLETERGRRGGYSV